MIIICGLTKGGILMQITDVNIRKMENEGKMKAIVSVTFDNALVVHDIKIIAGQDKLFLAMPSKRVPENEFRNIVHPINSEMRKTIEDAVLAKYNSENEGE